jgi:hypothetical protein
MLTGMQREILDMFWSEILATISYEIHRRSLHSVVDDILDDAITRTITAVATNRIYCADKIISRARSCALDSIRQSARRRTLDNMHRAAVEQGTTTIRGTAAAPDVTLKITPRHFRPELFYVALTTETTEGMNEDGDIVPAHVPCLQFASYGADFIE